MTGVSHSSERRRSVRLRPLPDLPIEVWLKAEGVGPIALAVIDVSVGGLAISGTPSLTHLKPDTRHTLLIKLPTMGPKATAPFEVVVDVRHRSSDITGTIGLMYVNMSGAMVSALGRYVAELLERGALS